MQNKMISMLYVVLIFMYFEKRKINNKIKYIQENIQLIKVEIFKNYYKNNRLLKIVYNY